MNCLMCNKKLLDEDNVTGWHKKCIKKFFGTTSIPLLDMTNDLFQDFLTESLAKGKTVPGVQKKISLYLNSNDSKLKMTLVDYLAGYILKPQVDDYDSLPEAEHLVMCMADITDIKTVPHALISIDKKYAYITKRIDRITRKNNNKMLAMEDFCQLGNKLTEDKYNSSYENCYKIIKKYSSFATIDIIELFIRIVFSFVVGNSDMHLKNFSLIEHNNSSSYSLSKVYDIIPANLILKEDTEQFALTLNGKKRNVTKNDFKKFAKFCEIDDKVVQNIFNKVLNLEDKYMNLIDESLLSEVMKNDFKLLIKERLEVLK